MPAAHAALVGIDWAVPAGWPGCRLRPAPERVPATPIGCSSEPWQGDSNRQSPCLYTLTELDDAVVLTSPGGADDDVCHRRQPNRSASRSLLLGRCEHLLPPLAPAMGCYFRDAITAVIHMEVQRVVLKDEGVTSVVAFLSVEASALADTTREAAL